MKTVIVAINAKNIHKALAPWCLKVYCENLGLKNIGVIEVNINDTVNEIAGRIFKSKADIAAFSCYIWNIDYVVKIAGMLKKLIPHIKIILGGPEVSFEKDLKDYPFTDYIISGPGERTFFELLSGIENRSNTPPPQIIKGYSEVLDGFPSDCAKTIDCHGDGVLADAEKQVFRARADKKSMIFCQHSVPKDRREKISE